MKAGARAGRPGFEITSAHEQEKLRCLLMGGVAYDDWDVKPKEDFDEGEPLKEWTIEWAG
jgi:hypothetical protein